MFHEKIKALFSSAVDSVASTISKYSVHPDKDFTRQKKLPPDKLITFLVSQGSSSTSEELLEFFDLDADAPSVSALNQQRAKLKPEAMEAVFHHFHSSLSSLEGADGYESIAADGSTFSFFSKPTFASPDYFVSEGHSAKGFYSLHLNALYNLDKHIYTDALIQPIHNKDEYRAFATLVDRHQTSPWKKTIFIGDRGYCSYNNMAHVLKKGQFFLFRAKDIHSKGLLSGFDFPDKESFDIRVRVTLVRSQSKKIAVEGYRRFVDKATSFDFIEYGTRDTYQLTFHIVRFPISESTYECLVTWAKLIAYNLTESIINHTAVVHQKKTKHDYKIHFGTAAHICRVFLRPSVKEGSINVTALLQRRLIPIRNERQYHRLKTAHFRRPRYLIYRAA